MLRSSFFHWAVVLLRNDPVFWFCSSVIWCIPSSTPCPGMRRLRAAAWLPSPQVWCRLCDVSASFPVVVQSLSRVRLFATPWTAACQASLSFTISQSLLKLMSIESVMPSNHPLLCHPLLLLPSIFPRKSKRACSIRPGITELLRLIGVGVSYMPPFFISHILSFGMCYGFCFLHHSSVKALLPPLSYHHLVWATITSELPSPLTWVVTVTWLLDSLPQPEGYLLKHKLDPGTSLLKPPLDRNPHLT